MMRIIFDWSTRGVEPSSSDHQPYTQTDPKGMTDPLGRRVRLTIQLPILTTYHLRVFHGTYMRSTHMSLHGNYLHITTKDSITQSDLLYMGRWSQISWDPSLYKEIPSYQGIQVSSPLLYQPQTLTFLI